MARDISGRPRVERPRDRLRATIDFTSDTDKVIK